MSKSYREHSKQDWIPKAVNDMGFPGREVMGIGCLQRIADATELMAKDRVQMEANLEYYKERKEYYSNLADRYRKSMIAYKAHNTRLKNKLKQNV